MSHVDELQEELCAIPRAAGRHVATRLTVHCRLWCGVRANGVVGDGTEMIRVHERARPATWCTRDERTVLSSVSSVRCSLTNIRGWANESSRGGRDDSTHPRDIEMYPWRPWLNLRGTQARHVTKHTLF
eukprot:SAG11_NODE_2117_length_3792_cov_2.955321_7_plen_129_part_00